MKLYGFDEVGEGLELLPLAARRALDAAGLKLGREAWAALPLEAREALASEGSAHDVDTARVRDLCAAAKPQTVAVRTEPAADRAPAEVLSALGEARPLPAALWSSLSALDRYALSKAAERSTPERVDAAYREIVGATVLSTHLSPQGTVRMVSVGQKEPTLRRAQAESFVSLSSAGLQRLRDGNAKKGDVLATARIAGIQAAKRTADWIPLCHSITLTRVEVELELQEEPHRLHIVTTAEAHDRTGVEMEALVAASAAALTVYDMLKAYDRGMELGPTRLLAKSGGRSGDYRR